MLLNHTLKSASSVVKELATLTQKYSISLDLREIAATLTGPRDPLGLRLRLLIGSMQAAKSAQNIGVVQAIIQIHPKKLMRAAAERFGAILRLSTPPRALTHWSRLVHVLRPALLLLQHDLVNMRLRSQRTQLNHAVSFRFIRCHVTAPSPASLPCIPPSFQ
jgi:hypothetical protein